VLHWRNQLHVPLLEYPDVLSANEIYFPIYVCVLHFYLFSFSLWFVWYDNNCTKYVSYQLSTAEPGSAVRIQANYVFSWSMRGKGNSTFRTINSWENRFVIGILYFNVHTNARTTWHETSASWIIKFYFVIDCKLRNKTYLSLNKRIGVSRKRNVSCLIHFLFVNF